MPTYRVFNPAGGPVKLPAGVTVDQTYPAFVVVTGDDAAIAEVRKSYPVEPLDRASSSGPSPASARTAAVGGAVVAGSGPQDVVVRFKAPVRPEWMAALAGAGAEVKRPIGDSAVVVTCPTRAVLAQVQGLAQVDRVDAHVPEIQVSPEFVQALGGPSDRKSLVQAADQLGKAGRRRKKNYPSALGLVVATFLSNEDCGRAKKALAGKKIRGVHDAGHTQLVVNLGLGRDPEKSLEAITELPGLLRLEEKTIPKLHNNVARAVIGAGVVSSNPGGLGLTGKGEIAAVADTGLDTGDPATVHPDFRGRIKDLASFPIAASWSSLVANPGGDDGPADLYSGHGTHTSGSVLGDGSRTKALGLSPIQGMAPEAQLVFQAIEQTPQWTAKAKINFLRQGVQPPNSGLYGIPDDLSDLFQAAYDQGARVHSDSWGGGQPGAYESQCESVDRFVWNHPDFLIVIAAGNDGKQGSPAGTTIELGSVTPPGTAKNCLTVGASENDRDADFKTTYGGAFNDFPNPEIRDDSLTNSVDHIVAFSSRGPCQTGRRKPDVIAPGTYVLSTRSSRIARNNFAWAAYPPAKDDYMYDSGTSMATPLVAGAAVLVRQYLRQVAKIDAPSAALLKAAIVHSARYTAYKWPDPSSARWADHEQGWGRVALRDVLAPAAPRAVIFQDEGPRLTTGDSAVTKVKITGSTVPLKVTMVFTDYPGENLVNNLNLMVSDPGGKFYLGNDFARAGAPDPLNNVEGVVVDAPAVGEWAISVVASEVQQGMQAYALVISGEGAVATVTPPPTPAPATTSAVAPAKPKPKAKAKKPKVKAKTPAKKTTAKGGSAKAKASTARAEARGKKGSVKGQAKGKTRTGSTKRAKPKKKS